MLILSKEALITIDINVINVFIIIVILSISRSIIISQYYHFYYELSWLPFILSLKL